MRTTLKKIEVIHAQTKFTTANHNEDYFKSIPGFNPKEMLANNISFIHDRGDKPDLIVAKGNKLNKSMAVRSKPQIRINGGYASVYNNKGEHRNLQLLSRQQ